MLWVIWDKRLKKNPWGKIKYLDKESHDVAEARVLFNVEIPVPKQRKCLSFKLDEHNYLNSTLLDPF